MFYSMPFRKQLKGYFELKAGVRDNGRLVGKTLEGYLSSQCPFRARLYKVNSYQILKALPQVRGRAVARYSNGLQSELSRCLRDLLPGVQMRSPGIHQVGEADSQVPSGNHEIRADSGK